MDETWANEVGIIGAGVMGLSLAHAVTAAGIAVVVVDTDDTARAAAETELRQQRRLARLASGREQTGAVGALRTSSDIDAVHDCRLVIENVTEDPEIKRAVHRDLDRVLQPDAVVAVNTSAVPISSIALGYADPSRVVGAHFMNPVATSSMVEVIRAETTSDHALDTLGALLQALDKSAVVVQDAAGFVINRCLMMFINEAADLVDQSVATVAQVDRLFRGCLGHRTGPLRTADLIGIDTIVDTLKVLADHYGPERFTPSVALVEMVRTGKLGRKTGAGFYDYEES